MKKLTVLLGILPALFFNTSLKAQDSISNADLLKRIEALENEKKKSKEWDTTFAQMSGLFLARLG